MLPFIVKKIVLFYKKFFIIVASLLRLFLKYISFNREFMINIKFQ